MGLILGSQFMWLIILTKKKKKIILLFKLLQKSIWQHLRIIHDQTDILSILSIVLSIVGLEGNLQQLPQSTVKYENLYLTYRLRKRNFFLQAHQSPCCRDPAYFNYIIINKDRGKKLNLKKRIKNLLFTHHTTRFSHQ